MNRSQRIAAQLGMPHGTANHKLRKNIMFKYVVLAGDNFCYKCGAEIELVDELSIEHKLPWEGRDTELFWDLGNIAFSHVTCNRPHTFSSGPPVTKLDGKGKAWCNRCKQHLPVERFAKNNSKPSGLQNFCRACHESCR